MDAGNRQAGFKFNLFVSYTRTPDAALAREIERFLEAFHTTPLKPDFASRLTPLHICVDGSDFSLPPFETADAQQQRDILAVVYGHLAQARELLVLCSEGAARSRWVDKEIRWFIEHRGAGAVRIALTDGAQPWDEPERYFPIAVREHDLHKGIAYDLRGHDARRSRDWVQVPQFQREMVRLASDLLGIPAGDLYPTWLEAELDRVRRQSLTLASTARFETLGGDPSRALLIAHEAHELHPGEATELALREAYKVSVLHHYNRREFSRISGSGPSYLAGRWKQGDVFTRTSPDGKYRLLVTERGRDGPNPPGDVYLVSNETLRAVKLQPPEGRGGRVEEVAFDRASRHVFVTRYFNLAVYATDGRYIGGYEFSRHTKSPVHLVDGYFAGKYILGAETKGGVWLVDLHGDRDSTLTVLPEFHRDATIFTDLSPDSRRASLVFESGRAAVLTLGADGKPVLTDIPAKDVLFAGFDGRNDSLITSGQDGSIIVWDLDESPRESGRMKPLPVAIDWVSRDASGVRLAAVGANQKLYIIDRASGELLNTLDYRSAIDWKTLRSVAVPERVARPAPAEALEEALPHFPSPQLAVANVQRAGDTAWIFTETWEPNALTPNRAVFRVEPTGVRRLPGVHAGLVEEHLDLLWMRVAPGYGGTVLRNRDGNLRRFPAKDLEVNCVLRKGDSVLLGTRQGAFLYTAGEGRLITPENLMVQGIEEVGGRVWIRGAQGAWLFEDGSLIRVAEPFLDIRQIKAAHGEVWFLTKTDVMFDSDGPAYRVHGYFSTALPGSRSKISDVLETTDAAWLADQGRLYRVAGDQVTEVSGFEANVDGILQTGRVFWLTTHTRGLFAGKRATYRMDEGLTPERLEFTGYFLNAAGRTWLQYVKDGRSILAEPTEQGLREINLGEGAVTQIATRGGEPWILTTAGVYRTVGERVERMDLPVLAYHGWAESGEALWLFAAHAAVRVTGDSAIVVSTGDHRPVGVRRAGRHEWLMTTSELGGPGPAYRVAKSRAKAFKPPEGGVVDAVELGDEVWLLTRKDGRAGPMLRGR